MSGFLAVFARLAAGLPAGGGPAGRFGDEEDEATALVMVGDERVRWVVGAVEGCE